MEQGPVSRSLAFDYAVGICSLWIASGFFLDAWAHGHVPVETFFTPYHGVFYSGMAAMIVTIAVFALRNRLRGYRWQDCVPAPYRVALLGIPIFIVAGVGDMLWHFILGIEEGVDALLSPSHQGLGLGMFFLSSGPIRSVLADRDRSLCLGRQFPLVLGLATWLVLLHFGTAYAFDPAAGLTNAPPPISPFTSDYLNALAIGYYKVAMGVLVLIFQSTVMAVFAMWLVSRLRTQFGTFTLLYLLGNVAAAAAFTNYTPLLAVTIAQSIVTGLVADSMVARLDPQPERRAAFLWFAAIVPATYSGVYLLATAAADRLWWDWNVSLGAWVWTGVCGFALGLLATARRNA
ncbi:MAG: hypothetical protein JO199_08200 [Candidatus Eremiobacteraeota bacterium]|nr:hypothetical protein [Candidatus Eremiobacteraeota bacterium]